jgi:hypothetical protein
MSYVDRFLTYAPLTDTLDVCGGDTVPSYVRVENKHFAPHTKGRFRVYVPEDQLEQLNEKLEEYDNYIQWLASVYVPEKDWDKVYDEMTKMGIDYRGADDV